MPVLRIKENVEELLDKDPYELFSLDEPHMVARRMRPEFWGAAFVGVLLAFGIAFLTFWRVQQDAKEGGDTPYAYFEIKAIDPDGRPVAGAMVREGERQLGVTDSFGEWRRFLRVKPGSTVALQIVKKTAAGTLVATKNLAVPMTMPAGGDLELSGSVQLVRPGMRGAPVSRRKTEPGSAQSKTPASPKRTASAEAPEVVPAVNDETSIEASQAMMGAAGMASAPAARGPANTAAAAAPHGTAESTATPEPEVIAAETETPAAAPIEAAAPVKVPAGPDPYASLAVSAQGTSTPALVSVIAALKKRAAELGVRPDDKAPWHLLLTDILVGPKAGGGESHLIVVDGYVVQGGRTERVFTYLRNYAEESLYTARDILWAATVHVAKTHQAVRANGAWFLESPGPKLWAQVPGHVVYDLGGMAFPLAVDGDRLRLTVGSSEPCATGNRCAVTSPGFQRVPPVPGWQRLKLKVRGGDANTTVYVSGYEAWKVQDKVYEYWGAPMGAANVTGIRNGRLIYRGRIQAGGATLPGVTLPSPAISRR